MGIYVQCFAENVPEQHQELGEQIVRSAERWAQKRGLGELFFGVAHDGGSSISFFPPGGTIRFDVSKGRVVFDAKTSIGGPGFHAATIDLCDHLAADLGLRWRWDVGGDQTGYAQHRDFSRLESDFTHQFLSFCEFYDRSTGKGFALNLAEGLAHNEFDGVATPMGPLPVAFFKNALHDTEHLIENARRIFPWWNTHLDEDFWLNVVRATLWAEVEWRPPRTPWETYVLKAASRAGTHIDLERETKLADAFIELNDLVELTDNPIAPKSQGIGYRRGKRSFRLTGPWHINLPGYYIEQWEDDGTTLCLWFGSEEVRGSSWTHSPEPGIRWHRDFADCEEISGPTCKYRVGAARAAKDQAGGFHVAANFHATNNPAKGQLLHLSLFTLEPNARERMIELAKEVWAEPPREQPTKAMDA